MSLPLSKYEVVFEQRQIGCGSLRQLPMNTLTAEVDLSTGNFTDYPTQFKGRPLWSRV